MMEKASSLESDDVAMHIPCAADTSLVVDHLLMKVSIIAVYKQRTVSHLLDTIRAHRLHRLTNTGDITLNWEFSAHEPTERISKSAFPHQAINTTR